MKPTIILVYSLAGGAVGFLFGQLYTLDEVRTEEVFQLEKAHYICKEVYPWNKS